MKRKSFLSVFSAVLLSTIMIFTACNDDDDKDPVDQTIDATLTAFSISDPVTALGTIDEGAATVSINIPADEDVSALTVTITVPEGVTVSPASGSVVDFTSAVTFTVTGADKDGNAVSKDYVVTVTQTAVIGFIGKGATIDDLEDDAKAAATWMEAKYGNQFAYFSPSDINADALRTLKVLAYYELSVVENAEPDMSDFSSVKTVISNWVRDGGNLFLAGDGCDMIFEIDRLPRATYDWTEKVVKDNAADRVEGDKPADDFWGFSVKSGTTSEIRADHALFTDVLNPDSTVYLFNGPTREVRLFGYTYADWMAPACCAADMVTGFEGLLNAVKLGSLRHVGDGWGFMALEFKRTDKDVSADISAEIPKDFKGTVLMFSNHIVGYEWVANDGVNEYHDNIEKITENAIGYLKDVYDAQ